jgi:ABC-type Fe3+/spermidine/putrescine transport system ATPase subunit
MISGFEAPSEGTVWLRWPGRDGLASLRRDVNQVFRATRCSRISLSQKTSRYGLKMRGQSNAAIAQNVQRGH